MVNTIGPCLQKMHILAKKWVTDAKARAYTPSNK